MLTPAEPTPSQNLRCKEGIRPSLGIVTILILGVSFRFNGGIRNFVIACRDNENSTIAMCASSRGISVVRYVAENRVLHR